MIRQRCFICLAGMLLAALPAWGAYGPGERQPRRPPQEAYDACKGKIDGESVEVTTPRGGAMKAVCRMLNGELVAVPAQMQSPDGSQPVGTPPDGASPR